MQQAPTVHTPSKTAPAPGPAKEDIVVSRGRFGVGFVIVRGLDQLRDQLNRSGIAEVFLERSNQPLRLRRDGSGDLIRAE